MKGQLMNRVLQGFGFVVALGMFASPVLGQGNQPSTTLNQFHPSQTVEDGFALSRPDDLGHLRFGAQLHLDYANDPLVYESDLGDASSESQHIVRHQLTGTLGLSLGVLDRLVIYAGLPINLVMSGDDTMLPMGVAATDGAGLGDAYLGARIRLFGEWNDAIALALQITATFPSGGGVYRGDETLTLHPQLLFEARAADKVRLTVNVGARLGEDQTLLGDVRVGDALTFGLGVTASLVGTYTRPDQTRVDLHAQVFGSSFFGDFFGGEETPLEALAGLKLHLGNGLVIGAAGGAGIHRSFGTPDARAVLNLGWGQVREIEEEPEPVVADTDRDGILDDVDECPDDPEDRDGFEDEDGCPDPDNDRDGILDGDDLCPNDPEDMDDFQDEDGCPDPDNDSDRILDVDDSCPNDPETYNGFEDEDGCPDRGSVVIEDNSIIILEKIYFETDSAVIMERSYPIIEAVAATLNGNPQITMIEIQGHADERGDDNYNIRLTRDRAASVVEALAQRGVLRDRLRSAGYGERCPVDPRSNREAWERNRRVEFKIIRTEDGPTGVEVACPAGRDLMPQ